MLIKQFKNHIEIDQDHYFAAMDIPCDPQIENEDLTMDEDGQSEFRSLLGRIGWLGNHSSPDRSHISKYEVRESNIW